jgi:O-antigen/teichoic acid export membrane protein
LELFGYYTLASIVSGALYQFITPITQAYLPRFTELAAQNNTKLLIKIYHQAAQLINLVMIPAALTLVLFGDKLLLLWTHNTTLTENVAPLLRLLAIGTLFNGFMNIPYLLSLAYGWAKFAVYLNFVAVILLIPAMIWATLHYGAIGAAWIWLILNAGYILVGVHFLYRRLLTSEKWQWYKNLLISITGVFLVGKVCALLLPTELNKIAELTGILISGGLMVSMAWWLSPDIKKRVRQ